jgi:serine/threonine protein kinase/class 3 adenylate cyclase
MEPDPPGSSADRTARTGIESPAGTGEGTLLQSDLKSLGRYRILSELGRGGMGIVFLAEDTELGRRVALKVLAPRRGIGHEERARFVRETRAMAAVSHENVVTVFDVGHEGEIPFFAMELLEGESLADTLHRQGHFPAGEILAIGRGIGAGLAAAHAKGLVHRDVKPSNVWLEAGVAPRDPARVRLLDFGLVRPIDSESDVTDPDFIVGTPAYMSPEQARGERADARSDLWSLGCVLYEMETGHHPFASENPIGSLTRAASVDPAPPRSWEPSIPGALADLTLRLLSRSPEGRPASANELLEELDTIEAALPGAPSPSRIRRDPVELEGFATSPLPDEPGGGSADRKNSTRGELSLVSRPERKEGANGEGKLRDLRVLLEELCCDLCRFEYATLDSLDLEKIRIDREVERGESWADIRVRVPGRPDIFVEVKTGYSDERLVDSLRRKYGPDSPDPGGAARLVLVVDAEGRSDWEGTEREIARMLSPRFALEVWNDGHLAALLRRRFGTSIDSITEGHLVELRRAVDRAKAFHAFGNGSFADFTADPLHAQILWHLGFWRTRQISKRHGLAPTEVLRPGIYRDAVVVIADICSFSAFVRDTADPGIVASALTAFYSRARYEILNAGGMLHRFTEDKVTGIFGVPEGRGSAPCDALESARAIASIGRSVLHQWQEEIERIQPAKDVHVALAIGDVQLVPERPFSRSHVGVIGEPVHTASVLLGRAGPGEIVVSNALARRLPQEARAGFAETDPVDVPGIGRIRAWKGGSRGASG